MICIGHRGASGHKPENTLSAFAHALELGCEWVELDVYHIEDELLVFHDDTLDRCTNGTGNISDQSLAYLRGLDAGQGQQIPTLREVAALIDRKASINVELKGPKTAAPVCSLLDELVSQGWHADQFLLSSFYHDELAKADPKYRRGVLFHKARDYFATTDTLGAWALNLSLKIVDADTVKRAHDRGLKVFVYTVNEPDDIDNMRTLGVDGLFSDYPDRVLG